MSPKTQLLWKANCQLAFKLIFSLLFEHFKVLKQETAPTGWDRLEEAKYA